MKKKFASQSDGLQTPQRNTTHKRSHEHRKDDETQLPSRGSNGSQQNVLVPLWCVRVCVFVV